MSVKTALCSFLCRIQFDLLKIKISVHLCTIDIDSSYSIKFRIKFLEITIRNFTEKNGY